MRLLIIEDDPALRQQLCTAAQRAGYVVGQADNGVEGHYLGEVEVWDAVVLDLGLPQLDGLSVLQRWRGAGLSVPVLVLTARDTWSDKVMGIDSGADDYLTKPFHMEELLARLRALIRRASGHATAVLQCGQISLDTCGGRVYLGAEALTLTGHELRLLSYLMHKQGHVVSRTELTEHLYAQDHERDSNTIDVFIARLRKKLGASYIETLRGLGYRLQAPQ